MIKTQFVDNTMTTKREQRKYIPLDTSIYKQ